MLVNIQSSVDTGRIFWKKHGLERMMERGITRSQVKNALLNGQIIEQYPNDYPIPSVLLAIGRPEALHVVVAFDKNTQQCHIITAYYPDLIHFNEDLITRRLS